jgi:GntR family transcriptional regulator
MGATAIKRSENVRSDLAKRLAALEPGSKLPSEQTLAETLGVSRNTAREALGELEAKKLIHRRWGEGTFLSRNRDLLSLSLNDLTPMPNLIKQAGMEPHLQFAKCDKVRDNDIAPLLGADGDAQLWKFVRLYTGNNRPVVLLEDYLLSVRMGRALDLALFKESISKLLLEQWQVAPSYAISYIEAALSDAFVSDSLQIKPGSPVLLQEQTAFSAQDEPLIFTRTYIPSQSMRPHIIRHMA